MKQILAGLVFGGYLAAAWAFARRGALPLPEAARRTSINLFLVYLVAASFAAGLTQKNLWPFSNWPLIAPTVPRQSTEVYLVGVDSDGGEHQVDYRAWEPLALRELLAWIARFHPHLEPAAQDSSAAYLLRTAESARQRARAGGGAGYLDRFLGPLAAPYFLLHPEWWNDPADVPALPFVRLRIYWVDWDMVDRAAGTSRSVRRDVYEFPRP